MASEESFEEPRLCANGCGFFSSSATNNLCSKCYRDFNIKKHAMPMTSTLSQSKDSKPDDHVTSCASEGASTAEDVATKQRCGCCNKRVGLTKGFKCRCGNTYCVMHRYPEEHDCPFDFKTAGRVLLAKANPLIRGDKLDRF